MGSGVETFVLYMCSYNEPDDPYSGNTTQVKYTYFLFSQANYENENKVVKAKYTDIKNSIVTSKDIEEGDEYVSGNAYGSITSTITGILPTATNTIQIREANGYVLDYLTVEYQGYEYKIFLNDVANNRDTDGYVTNYELDGKYQYAYHFTHILTDDEGNTSTFYFIDNDIYLQFTRIYRTN